jgi:glucose-6-phosphate isomerase
MSQTESYGNLKEHFNSMNNVHMRDLFATDANRFERFSIQWEQFLFDYSKNLVTDETLELLLGLAHDSKLSDKIEVQFAGEKINNTENRAVLHTALRNRGSESVYFEGIDIMPGIRKVLEQMKQFTNDVHSGKFSSYTNQRFTDVVNIGIGGSDLGPKMVCNALKKYASGKVNIHFVSNVDATDIEETLRNLNPETTLFVIASKTFTTWETLTNANTAKSWFLNSGASEADVAKHFVALSTNHKACNEFGIPSENMFEFWDWVGGRYSLWSAIGLPISLYIGYDNFEKLLDGAFKMDTHFRNTLFEQNIPVLMALLGIWYVNFWGFDSHAVIPYDHYLERFSEFLQQLDMESNGKRVSRDGMLLDYSTGPVIWGTIGTNSQHSFFQLLHQGTGTIPADFIAFAQSLNPTDEHHNILMSNFFAQTEAMMMGKNADEVELELNSANMTESEIKKLLPHKLFPGNKPTNTILIDKLTPETLGMLIAMYEHKVFVQGVIWDVNSYDQWGGL